MTLLALRTTRYGYRLQISDHERKYCQVPMLLQHGLKMSNRGHKKSRFSLEAASNQNQILCEQVLVFHEVH